MKGLLRYLVNGKDKRLTYTCAIHTPTLNANLISVNAFDKARLMVAFGGGLGVVRKCDGTPVSVGENEVPLFDVTLGLNIPDENTLIGHHSNQQSDQQSVPALPESHTESDDHHADTPVEPNHKRN